MDLAAEGITADLKGTPLEVSYFVFCRILFKRLYYLARVHLSLQVGKGIVRRSGKDVALVGYGSSVNECLGAAELLSKVKFHAYQTINKMSLSELPSLKTLRGICRLEYPPLLWMLVSANRWIRLSSASSLRNIRL